MAPFSRVIKHPKESARHRQPDPDGPQRPKSGPFDPTQIRGDPAQAPKNPGHTTLLERPEQCHRFRGQARRIDLILLFGGGHEARGGGSTPEDLPPETPGHLRVSAQSRPPPPPERIVCVLSHAPNQA